MDLQNLRKEIEAIQQNSKTTLESITCISTYYKSFLSHGEEAQSKMLGKVKRLISNNIQSSFKVENTLNLIYSQYEGHLNKCQDVFGKLVSDIILPLDIFLTKINDIYSENITKLLKILKEVSHAKLVLDNSHLTYIQQTHHAKQYEHSTPKEGLDKDKLLKLKSIALNSEKLYKYELIRYNKITTNCNNVYVNSSNILKENEESRIIFIQTTVIQFSQLLQEYNELIDLFKTTISGYFPKEIWDQELNDIINSLNCYSKLNNNDCDRIKSDKLVLYNEFKNSGVDLNECFNHDEIQIPAINEDEQKNIINLVINKLLEENEIQGELISQLMEVIRNNADAQKKFLDLILERKKIFTVKFTNLKNLYHLSNIICHITLSQESIFTGRFELNFSIIFIAERVFYQNKADYTKIYLSALLSQNKIYRTKVFWTNFIELKLANKLNDHIQRVKNMQFSEEDKPSFLSKISNAFGLNYDPKKVGIIEGSRFYSLLEQYDKLDNDRKEIIGRIVSVEILSLIKECTPNFANFNFDKALYFINELAEKYQIPKTHLSFLETYYNVSTFTIRRKLPNDNKTINSQLTTNVNTESKLTLLKYVFTFSSNQDLLSLLTISKTANKLISKRLYKHILQQQDLNIKVRLQIWHMLLKTRTLKQQYNYQNLLNTIATNEEAKVKNDIDKDVHRTYVSNTNDSEGKTKLSNILRLISQCNGTIRYCQGMNYLAQFLLELTQNEEEAFFLFLGLFTYTEYPLIFAKDLHKLRSFFYVVCRLISLYEPEIYSYLLSNSLDVQSFSAAWFITLFVNARPHIKEPQLPQVILRILDGFLLSGWKAIIKVSINLLHLYENKLMEFKAETLLMFVMKEMIRSDFFKSKNVGQFDMLYKRTPIKRKLIDNIENEYIQDEKIKELEPK